MKREPWTTEQQRHEQRFRNNRAVGARFGLPSRDPRVHLPYIVADTQFLHLHDRHARFEWLSSTPGLTGWYRRGVVGDGIRYFRYATGNCFEFTDQNTAFMFKMHWC